MASLQLCSGTWSSVKWGAIQEGFLQVWVQQEEYIVREQGPGGWGNWYGSGGDRGAPVGRSDTLVGGRNSALNCGAGKLTSLPWIVCSRGEAR